MTPEVKKEGRQKQKQLLNVEEKPLLPESTSNNTRMLEGPQICGIVPLTPCQFSRIIAILRAYLGTQVGRVALCYRTMSFLKEAASEPV